MKTTKNRSKFMTIWAEKHKQKKTRDREKLEKKA